MQRFSLYGVHKRDYQESVTTGQTDARTHRQTPDKVIPMCRYALQATQSKYFLHISSPKSNVLAHLPMSLLFIWASWVLSLLNRSYS